MPGPGTFDRMATGDVPGRGLLGEDRFIRTRDGRRLRLMQAGAGEDLVVLESGLGASGLSWGPVHTALSRHVRVAAYERAGYGASTPAPDRPRDLASLADDLAAVVGSLDHRRLVLVGHSWGGPIVRVLAARLVDQGTPPAGLVLVDPSDEHALELYTSRAARWSRVLQDGLLVPLARLRLLGPLMGMQAAGLTAPLLGAVAAASGSVEAAKAMRAEGQHLVEGLRDLRSRPPLLGDLPIGVISGQRSTQVDRTVRTHLVRAHHDTVAAHPGARLVPAMRSGHMVPITEPEIVVAEALRLLP